MKTSRDYQLSIINNIPKYLKEYGSTIVQSPTGSGKSHIIDCTVQRVIRGGKIPLVISDNLKIHAQLVHECNAMRLDSGVRQATIIDGYAYVAMAQSLRNRDAIIEQFHRAQGRLVVVVDECHRNTATPIIRELDPAYLVGFSATPHFKWAKHLPKLYNSLIHGPQINALIEDGYLCDYRCIIRTGAELDKLVERKGGDYTEESQEQVFGSRRMYDGMFEDLPLYRGRKTVIYVASIRQCEEMYSKLLAAGYNVCRYHSELENANYELSRFTHLHECDVCVSVSSLTLGWDYPPIDCVVLWRSTTSLPLYLQICGRGSRPCSPADAARYGISNYNKEQFTVLDYGGNYVRHGAWDMPRDWNEMWQDPKNKRKISTYAGVAGSKLCPLCQAVLAVSARSCYNCGYIYPEAEIQLIEGQLLEVKNTLNTLKNRKISELNAQELAFYAKANGKQQFATRIARRKEQDQQGFLSEFAKHMEYHPKWVNKQLELLPNDKINFFDITIR